MQQKMGLTKEQKTSTLINMSENKKKISFAEQFKKAKEEGKIKNKKSKFIQKNIDDDIKYATDLFKRKQPRPFITKKVDDPVDRKARGGRAGYSKGGGVRKIAKGCGAVMRRKKTLYI
jgi:hypothetical protein